MHEPRRLGQVYDLGLGEVWMECALLEVSTGFIGKDMVGQGWIDVATPRGVLYSYEAIGSFARR